MNINTHVLGKIIEVTKPDILDEWVEIRESDSFDARWMSAYDDCPDISLRYPESQTIHDLLFQKSKGHELIRFVLDDLDLIYAYEVYGASHDMVDHLKEEYAKGVFPLITDLDAKQGGQLGAFGAG